MESLALEPDWQQNPVVTRSSLITVKPLAKTWPRTNFALVLEISFGPRAQDPMRASETPLFL